jgi:AmiR/NasT family two-component response regulator
MGHDRTDPADPNDDEKDRDRLAALEEVSQRLREVTEKVDHLTIALQSRDVIGQAKGILMERYGLTSEQAFELLTVTSSNTNTKLLQVAVELVATGRLSGTPQQ